MAHPSSTGYQTLSYVSPIDDSAQPIALWIPTTYSPRRQYPIVVALHGMDGDERMIPEECLEIPHRGFSEKVILLSIFGRGDIAFEGPGEADLWDALAWVKQRYRVNPRRQFLTGPQFNNFERLALGF